MFTQLHAHGHYSLLEAIGSPKAYVAKAKDLCMKAVCFTDYGGMYGCIEFYKAAKKENIKPLLWVELWLVHDISIAQTGRASHHYASTITLIAENLDWYQALLELVTKANTDWFYGIPRIDFALLNQFWSNLIAIQWTQTSAIGSLITKNESVSKQKEILWMLQKACGDDSVYLEISTWDEKENKWLKAVNDWIIALHEETNIPIIVSNNVHYIEEEDKKPFGVALSIKDWKRVFDDDRRKVTGDWNIIGEKKSRIIMETRGYDIDLIDKCFATVSDIIERCTVELQLNQLLFPKYETPKDIAELYASKKDDLITT